MIIEVTQVDRLAAAAYMKLVGSTRWSLEGILSGQCDNVSVVQAFAAHRVTSALALTTENKNLRNGLAALNAENKILRAKVEGLTIERNFHRQTADLHAARVAELEAAAGGPPGHCLRTTRAVT